MALESPFGGSSVGKVPSGPKSISGGAKNAAKGTAKKATGKIAAKAAGAAAAAAGVPGGEALADSGAIESMASKVPKTSPFDQARGREATPEEVSASIRDIKGGRSIAESKPKPVTDDGEMPSIMASSPFDKSPAQKSGLNPLSSDDGQNEESETEEETEDTQEQETPVQKTSILQQKKKGGKGGKGWLLSILALLIILPMLFAGGCAVMITAMVGGVGGGMVNFSSQGDGTSCDSGDSGDTSNPDLKGSDDASSSLRDDVEAMGDGMETKGDDVYLDSEEVKSPIAGKVEDATENSVTIKSTRPGQNVELTISGLKDVQVKKGKTVKAGDVLGKAAEKKKPTESSKEEKYHVTMTAKEDGKPKSAEDFFNDAAGDGTEGNKVSNDSSDNSSGDSPSSSSIGDEKPELGLNSEQVHNAKMVIAIGEQMNMGENAIVGGLDVAQQESTLLNYGNNGNGAKSPMGGGNGVPVDGKYLAESMKDSRVSPTAPAGQDNNSTGIFQQQVVLESDGKVAPESEQVWGTWKQSMDPAYAAWKFFDAYKEKYPEQAANKNAPSSSVYGVQGSVDDSRPAAHHSKSEQMYSKWKGEGKKHDGLLENASSGKVTGTTTDTDSSSSDECADGGDGTSTSGEKGGGVLEANEGTLAANIVKIGDGELGKPYEQAAGMRSLLTETNPTHHDCSSFVSWIYWHAAGVWMSEDSGQGWGWHTGIFISRFHGKSPYHVTGKDYTEASSSAIDPAKDLKPGDIINTSPSVPQANGHVWMYVGNGEEIAAHSYGMLSSKSKPWTADAGGREFFIIRPLNAKMPEDVAGPKPESQKIPDKIIKLWKDGKKW